MSRYLAIVLSSIWKADLGGVLTALGVGSLVLGLALQDSLGNIFSGIALLFERPFALGDWLQIGDITGKVMEITWRSVHLRTVAGNLLIVPNSQLAKDSFSNLSRPTPLYETSFEVGFSYDDPPNKVKQILLQAALETEGVLRQPPPYLRVTAYGDFYINYKVFLLTKDYISSLRIRSDYITRVWYAAKRHNLTIPFPTANYYEYQVPPSSPAAKDYALQLRLFPGMNSMDPSLLEQLAQESSPIEFAQGEIVIAQGDPILGLYLILEGKAEMIFNTPIGNLQVIEQLNAGEFFGEKICLFSGQISDVTVKALEDLSVLIIAKNSLNLLIANHPNMKYLNVCYR